MKILNIQDLLKHYKIDVEHIDLDDTFELEDMFHTRNEIVKKFNELSLDEVKEFLKAEQELSKYLPEIKNRYKTFYEKKVEPVNKELRNKLIPTKEEFIKGIEEFKKHEKRDAMYKVATFLISKFWGSPSNMADGLGVLLLTWNQAFYRYGNFDFDKLEMCIRNNLEKLKKFRNRDITTFSEADESDIKAIFNEFMESLQIAYGNNKGRKSPVAVAKALHILAPNFFPLWDNEIAKAYGCYYNNNPAEKYIQFMKLMKEFVKQVKNYIDLSNYPNKTLLKLIDEYNYSKYTKKWILNGATKRNALPLLCRLALLVT